MSRTFALVCHDCAVAYWAGQSSKAGCLGGYIYTSLDLDAFLFGHKNHRLEFGDDEFIGVDYDEFKAPPLDQIIGPDAAPLPEPPHREPQT